MHSDYISINSDVEKSPSSCNSYCLSLSRSSSVFSNYSTEEEYVNFDQNQPGNVAPTELTDWSLHFINNGLHVTGNDSDGKSIMTEVICNVKLPYLVQDGNKNVFKLRNFTCEDDDIPTYIKKKFTCGFPKDWYSASSLWCRIKNKKYNSDYISKTATVKQRHKLINKVYNSLKRIDNYWTECKHVTDVKAEYEFCETFSKIIDLSESIYNNIMFNLTEVDVQELKTVKNDDDDDDDVVRSILYGLETFGNRSLKRDNKLSSDVNDNNNEADNDDANSTVCTNTSASSALHEPLYGNKVRRAVFGLMSFDSDELEANTNDLLLKVLFVLFKPPRHTSFLRRLARHPFKNIDDYVIDAIKSRAVDFTTEIKRKTKFCCPVKMSTAWKEGKKKNIDASLGLDESYEKHSSKKPIERLKKQQKLNYSNDGIIDSAEVVDCEDTYNNDTASYDKQINRTDKTSESIVNSKRTKRNDNGMISVLDVSGYDGFMENDRIDKEGGVKDILTSTQIKSSRRSNDVQKMCASNNNIVTRSSKNKTIRLASESVATKVVSNEPSTSKVTGEKKRTSKVKYKEDRLHKNMGNNECNVVDCDLNRIEKNIVNDSDKLSWYDSQPSTSKLSDFEINLKKKEERRRKAEAVRNKKNDETNKRTEKSDAKLDDGKYSAGKRLFEQIDMDCVNKKNRGGCINVSTSFKRKHDDTVQQNAADIEYSSLSPNKKKTKRKIKTDLIGTCGSVFSMKNKMKLKDFENISPVPREETKSTSKKKPINSQNSTFLNDHTIQIKVKNQSYGNVESNDSLLNTSVSRYGRIRLTRISGVSKKIEYHKGEPVCVIPLKPPGSYATPDLQFVQKTERSTSVETTKAKTSYRSQLVQEDKATTTSSAGKKKSSKPKVQKSKKVVTSEPLNSVTPSSGTVIYKKETMSNTDPFTFNSPFYSSNNKTPENKPPRKLFSAKKWSQMVEHLVNNENNDETNRNSVKSRSSI